MIGWFITWNQPEYKEWAKKTKRGYLLVILRKEEQGFFCVKAELIMGKQGLPAVELTVEQHVSQEQDALKLITLWKTEGGMNTPF